MTHSHRMDGSQVMDRLDLEEVEQVSPKNRWHFMPDDADAPDLFFGSEAEACAAQQGYRAARGFHPIRGAAVNATELVSSMIQAHEALRTLAYHPEFGDDAPEFNEGGVGYEALEILYRQLTKLGRA